MTTDPFSPSKSCMRCIFWPSHPKLEPQRMGLLRYAVQSGVVTVLQSQHMPGFSGPSVLCLTSLPDFRVLWPVPANPCSSSGEMRLGSWSCSPWECLGVYFLGGGPPLMTDQCHQSPVFLSNWGPCWKLTSSIVKFSSGISYGPVARFFPRNLIFLR